MKDKETIVSVINKRTGIINLKGTSELHDVKHWAMKELEQSNLVEKVTIETKGRTIIIQCR